MSDKEESQVEEQETSEETLEGVVEETPTEPEAEPQPQVELTEEESLRQEIEALKKQLDENRDMAIRAQAELDNVRKRSLRDIENAHKYALDKFSLELLPVIDSLELGIKSAESSETDQSFKEGMDLTLKMFTDVLVKFGITEVESEGQKFNPEKHEAVSMQALEGVEAGIVATVFQKGYELNGRLIRPAMVVVSQ